MVGVVMGLQDAAQAMGREALAQIGQARVDQPALRATFDQRATGATAPRGINPRAVAGRAAAVVHRHLTRIAGAE